jgi:[ribosomal protein S18]-alanine N-acetyltransferase
MRRSVGISEPEPAELEVSPMKRRHLKGVMAIEREVYPRPWSPSLFISEMSETGNRSYLVAKLGKDVVAYGGVICYGEEAHITTIAVDPEHHRHKIGTRMMFELMSEAIRLGAGAVSLEVRMSNWGAQRMYGRFGFRPVGVRKGYYQETGEDALVMWADDVRTDDYRRTLDAIISAVPDGVRPRS